jgi:hypothetical protein
MGDNMKDDDIKKDDDQVVKEPDVKTVTPGLETPGKGVLDKIASVFRRDKKEDTVVEDDITVEDDTTVEDDLIEDDTTVEGDTTVEDDTIKNDPPVKQQYVEIDPRFIAAAKAYGWSDGRIQDYANEHEDIDIITLTGRMEELVADTKPIKEEELIDNEALNALAEADPNIAQVVRSIVEPMAKHFKNTASELDTLKGQIGTQELDKQNQEDVRNQATAEEIFDASGVSSLGKTSDIPKYPDGTYVLDSPIVVEREKVWRVATQFYANGGSFKEAVKNAMQWYSGGSVRKDTKRKVVKELIEQEKRVMPKRQETNVEKQYASEEERKAAIINDAVRKYNKEFP